MERVGTRVRGGGLRYYFRRRNLRCTLERPEPCNRDRNCHPCSWPRQDRFSNRTHTTGSISV